MLFIILISLRRKPCLGRKVKMEKPRIYGSCISSQACSTVLRKHNQLHELFYYFLMCILICVCLCGYVHMCTGAQVWSEEEVRSPGTGLAGGCEVPDVGARNQTPVLKRATTALQPSFCSPPTINV